MSVGTIKLTERAPEFSPNDYETYKQNVKVWDTMGTTLNETQRAAQLHLGLPRPVNSVVFEGIQ